MPRHKFVDKNRQKRKYTRRNAPNSSSGSNALFAGLIPTIVLAAALFMTVIAVQQVQNSTPIHIALTWPAMPKLPTLPQVSVPQVSFPTIQPIPDVWTKPGDVVVGLYGSMVLWLQGIFGSMAVGLQQIISSFIQLLDPRPVVSVMGYALQNFVLLLTESGVLIWTGLAHVGGLFVQSMIGVWVHMVAGATTVGSVSIEYATRAWNLLISGSIFAFHILSVIVSFVYTVIVFIIMAIVHGVVAVADWIYSIIRIPFDAMGALWVKIKPYFDIFMQHVRMVGHDFDAGLKNINQLTQAATQK